MNFCYSLSFSGNEPGKEAYNEISRFGSGAANILLRIL